jgi:hypothetical protein
VVTQLLSEAKEQGQLKAEADPGNLASLVICAYEGLRHYTLVDPVSFQPERVLEAMLALVSEEVSVKLPRKGQVEG